jgi:two-component sensor histidine kinase
MDGRTDDAVLAGNEAVANTARHAYPDAVGEVEIAVEPTGEGAALFVRDEGRGPGPWEDTRGSGLGTKLMHHCSDTVAINGRDAGGTEVVLALTHKPG